MAIGGALPRRAARSIESFKLVDYLDKRFAQLFVLLTIVLLSGAGPWPQNIAASDSVPFVSELKAVAYPVFMIQAVRGFILLFQARAILVGIFLFQVFVVTGSIAGSGEYFYGTQSLIRMLGMSFGMLAAWRTLGMDRVITTATRVMVVLLVLSIFLAIFLPENGRHLAGSEHAGLWRGVFTHKNQLGAHACLVILLCAAVPSLARGWRGQFSLAAAATCLIFSGSSTATAVSVFAAAASIGFHVARALRLSPLPVALCYIIVGVISAFWLEDFLYYVTTEIFGKSRTFTGRMDVWLHSWSLGEQAPWFGNGPGFLDANQTARAWLESVTFIGINSTHNGYIGAFVDTGYLGLLAYLLPYVACIFSWFRRPHTGSQFDVLMITAPICLLVYNVFETADGAYTGLGTMFINLLLINRFAPRTVAPR